MANTYGSVTLNITGFSFQDAPSNINEIQVLPDPTTPNAVTTIVQGAGYSRTIYKIEGWTDVTGFGSLVSYKRACSSNTFTMYLGSDPVVSAGCIIQSLDGELELATSRVMFSLSLIEG